MSRKSDFDIFLDKYKPIQHPTEKDFYMYETYGEEYEMVKKHIEKKGNNYVWTLIQGDNGNLYLTAGWHFINRFGYFLTTIPFENEGTTRDYKY